jgi:translocation and assembly module TamA
LVSAGASAAAPNAVVEGLADGPLRSQIELAVGEARNPPRTVLDARRRASEAARDATALLRSEGYYEASVTADVARRPSPRAILRVEPGPRFRLVTATIDWVGAAPDPVATKAAVAAVGLNAGDPGRAADILAAEGRAIAELEKRGYADAEVRPREVVVDHAKATVKPTFRIASGALVRLGPVRSIGKDPTRVAWLGPLAPWKPGTPYDPALLAKLQKRLLDTGVYESATVALAQSGGSTGASRPVLVTLIDRPHHALELGASYSTTEGSGADAKWITYNRLGRGDSLILTAKLYDIQQRLDLEQDLPHWGRADQTLKVGGGFVGDRTPAYDDLGGGIRVDVVRRPDLINVAFVGASLDFTATREKSAVNLLATPVGENLKLFIATTRAGFTLDRSNSILDPSRGWRLEADAEPTFIAGDRTLGYLRGQAQLTGYLPFGVGLPVAAGRLKLGSIWGGSIPGVPADRRFFAGGGGSVRGFGYQQVGPRLSDNTPVGGLSLVEGSVEMRQRLGRKWGLVAFADAGTIGVSSTPSFRDLSVGVGAGLRYDLGFGPLRLDIATPVNPRQGDSPVQLYISIGQAF